MRRRTVIVFVLALAALPPGAATGLDVTPGDFSTVKPEGPYEVVAPRTAQPPKIDGDLGDAAWEKAAVIKPFWHGGTTDLAKDQTIAWLCFDKDNLYVAWACQDAKLVGEAVARDDTAIWRHDGVELFLSPERDPALERQFILSVAEARYDRRPGKEYGPRGAGWNPEWEGKIKRQPWGYTAEMRVPLAELTDVKKHPVGRGTVWTMKLTREDRGDHPGVRTSSWTPIGQTTGDLRAVGRLIFEDRNLLANGGAETAEADGRLPSWELTATKVNVTVTSSTEEKTEGARGAKIVVSGRKAAGAVARTWPSATGLAPQPVDTTYVFTADVKAVSPDNTLVAYFVVFQGDKTDQLNFKHNAGWQKVKSAITVVAGAPVAVPCLQMAAAGDAAAKEEGGGVVFLDNVRLEIVDVQEIGLDPDSFCLTGNATDAYRTRNRRIAGTYTYTEAMTTDPCFPYFFPEGDGPPQDYGLYRGDIPFDKGRLTDGHTATAVSWSSFWSSFQGRDITFDLKDEYEVTRVVVKATWPGLGMAHVFLKSPGETVYVRVASSCDLLGLKGSQLQRSDQREFPKLNQPARWVRVQTECRSPGNICEIEVWGKPLAKAGVKPKRVPYLQAGGAAPIKDPAGRPEPTWDTPPLFPMPKDMKLDGPAVALRDGLAIQYEPAQSARARTTAEVLRDELKMCFGLNATVAPAAEAGQPGAILVGKAADSPTTVAALARWGQTVTADSPGREGYVLSARDGRIVIGGSDDRGAFYGVQALLTLARKSAAGSWEVPGVAIRDWPDMKFRIIEGRPIPTENLVRALARFRVNYYTFKYQYINQAAAVDPFAERYFVNFIPFLDVNGIVIGRDPSLAERPADEKWQDMPQDARRNANPGHPRTWEIYFGELDKWLPKFHSDIVYIGMDETYQYHSGSRWNVSPESRALNMSAGPLLAWFLNKIDGKVKQYGKRLFMHDTPFFINHTLSYPGDPDPSWLKALPLLPKDIMFNVWHWRKETVLDPLGKQYGHELVHLVTSDRDWRAPATPGQKDQPWDYPGAFAGLNNYMAESSFTPTKLLETIWVGWNVKAVRPKDPAANAAVARYVPLWNNLQLGEPMPPSLLAGQDDFAPLDIAPAANRSRVDEVAGDGKGWVDLGPNADLRALKPGTVSMAGVPFRIIDEKENNGNSVVMVQNRAYTDRTMPDTVEIDARGVKASSLLFLHCLDNAPGWNYLRRKELAGFYFVVFEDGTYSKMELKYATSIGNWDGLAVKWEYNPAGEAMTYGKLAWQGQTTSGLTAHLYMAEWANPRPDLKIAKIILRSAWDPTMMNPMLLAVTAVHPRLAAGPAQGNLPSADLLRPAKPVGVLHDLAGGKDESERRYVAPDGTVIEAERIDNDLSDKKAYAYANDWRSYVGQVTLGGHQGARTDKLVFTFLKPTPLTGVLVTGRFREQRKAQDFAPGIYDIFLDVSQDGGKTWQEKASVRGTSPEEHGPVWMPLDGKAVAMARLRQAAGPSTHYVGFSSVKFYRRE